MDLKSKSEQKMGHVVRFLKLSPEKGEKLTGANTVPSPAFKIASWGQCCGVMVKATTCKASISCGHYLVAPLVAPCVILFPAIQVGNLHEAPGFDLTQRWLL